MSTTDSVVVGPDAMLAAGAAFAARPRAGDRIHLVGELGAGKTTFVRGIVAGLGHPDSREVASPTFALHHRYEGGRIPVDHLDLYRLPPPVDLHAEGLDTVMNDETSVTLIEWPERLRDFPGGAAFRIRIDAPLEDRRTVSITGLRTGVGNGANPS
jgi:tRNA threonylcarbamoyladenosine biosynthesis protein TsaE